MDVEFKSKLEELVDHVFELKFPSSAGFRPLSTFFSPESVAHPAKANLFLVSFLIEKFTKEGEVVADIMAGTGSTGIVASYLGRRSILVELEDKFIEWIKKNVERLEKNGGKKGEIKVLKGDARKLRELLGVNANSIITSPPYSESVNASNDPARRAERMLEAGLDPETIVGGKARCGEVDWKYGESKEQISNLPHGEISTIITSPPYAEANRGGGIAQKGYEGKYGKDEKLPLRNDRPLSDNPDNISNLSLGDLNAIDAVITSPPYADSRKQPSKINVEREVTSMETETRPDTKNRHTLGRIRAIESMLTGYGKKEENIGNFKYENLLFVDSIITSPPYEASVSDDKEGPLAGANQKKYGRWRKGTAKKHSYTQHDEPCKVDTIITSPPYEGSLEGTSRHTQGGIASRDPALAQTGSYATVMSFGVPIGYSPNKDNIGNLKKETYLEAMLKCYQECFQVLKPGGRIIIIVKPFVRNKKVVDLPFHSFLLLQRAGFRLEEILKFRLPSESFWRVLYAQRFPDVEKIAHEYVLVMHRCC